MDRRRSWGHIPGRVRRTGPTGWLAFGYLLVFGSIIAFTSFVRASQLLPVSVVSTHAFVNPLIAVLLGWALLDERITGRTLLSAAMVLVSATPYFPEQARPIMRGYRDSLAEQQHEALRRSHPGGDTSGLH